MKKAYTKCIKKKKNKNLKTLKVLKWYLMSFNFKKECLTFLGDWSQQRRNEEQMCTFLLELWSPV